MERSDSDDLQTIVEQAQKGNKEAFSKLYELYFTPVYRYVYFRVKSQTEAEDLAQDIFLKAYSSFSKYVPTRATSPVQSELHSQSRSSSEIVAATRSPLPYFYTIARNTLIDYRRKKKIPITDEEDRSLDVVDTDKNPEDRAVQTEEANMIKEKIAFLPEDQQDVIILRFINEFSTKEISALLGKNEEAVRQLQSRGLRALKGLIKNI